VESVAVEVVQETLVTKDAPGRASGKLV
jgi:hypothetical protein